MASTINASTTSTSGLIYNADASGILELQSNGVTGLTVGTGGNVVVNTNLTATTASLTNIRSQTANTAPVFRDSAGAEIGTLCRAWVNFNGQGTVAIRGSFNVLSITDGGVGIYTVNFINPMPTATYVIVANSHAVATVSNRNVNINSSTIQTTNTGQLTNIENGVLTDTDVMTIAVFA